MYKHIDLIDLLLSHLPEPVYETSVNWIDQFPDGTLGNFVMWAFLSILYYMAGCPDNPVSQEAMYVVFARVLCRKPSAFTWVLPVLWKVTKQKLPVTVWVMAQASQGDLCFGLYLWVHKLLPLLVGNKDPKSMDLILQYVENILSTPNARIILVNGAAARKGEHPLIPPPYFEILLRLTFPATKEATARFNAIYPVLKEVALAGPSTELVAQQIFILSLKLAGEGNPVLAKEAADIAIWSVTGNIDCCNHWDSLYKEHLQASVGILYKLKDHSLKLSSSPGHALTLNQTIKSFTIKNKQSITQGASNTSLYIEADNSCKVILGRLSRGNGFLKDLMAIIVAVLAFAVAVLFFRPGTTTELKNLFGSLKLHRHIDAITTALMN